MDSKEIIQTLNKRYTSKVYDNTKKISDEDMKAITESFRLAPSSLGLQPWHLFVISDKETKKKLSEVTHGYNAGKVNDCSHLLVIANQKKLSDDYLNRYIKSVTDARGETGFTMDMLKGALKNLEDDKGVFHTNQCFIALGFIGYTAALLGIDSTMMGGIEAKGYNEVLGLEAKGLNTVVAYAMGYASDKEKPSDKIKVRFPENQVITHI